MPDGKSQEKASRLKAALKENLKRRKAQARGRQAARLAEAEDPGLKAAAKRDKPSD